MRTAATVAAAVFLGCVAVGAPGEDIGSFLSAGPTLGPGKNRSARWSYEFQFTVDPKSVTGVQLSCGEIQGSAISLSAEQINADANGKARWFGREMLLNAESIPWLYSGGTTSAICQGVFSREGQPDSVARLPVTFSSAQKRTIESDLRNAHSRR